MKFFVLFFSATLLLGCEEGNTTNPVPKATKKTEILTLGTNWEKKTFQVTGNELDIGTRLSRTGAAVTVPTTSRDHQLQVMPRQPSGCHPFRVVTPTMHTAYDGCLCPHKKAALGWLSQARCPSEPEAGDTKSFSD